MKFNLYVYGCFGNSSYSMAYFFNYIKDVAINAEIIIIFIIILVIAVEVVIKLTSTSAHGI